MAELQNRRGMLAGSGAGNKAGGKEGGKGRQGTTSTSGDRGAGITGRRGKGWGSGTCVWGQGA